MMISLLWWYQKNKAGCMSKQWELKRAEVKVIGGYFGKLSCPAKFNEFYRQIDFVRSPFPNSEVVKTLTRKIVEEVYEHCGTQQKLEYYKG